MADAKSHPATYMIELCGAEIGISWAEPIWTKCPLLPIRRATCGRAADGPPFPFCLALTRASDQLEGTITIWWAVPSTFTSPSVLRSLTSSTQNLGSSALLT